MAALRNRISPAMFGLSESRLGEALAPASAKTRVDYATELRAAAYLFCLGLVHALSWRQAVAVFRRERRVRVLLYYCFVLNCVFLSGAYFLSSWLLAGAEDPHGDRRHERRSTWAQYAVTLLYLIPLYIFSFKWNGRWCTEIAELTAPSMSPASSAEVEAPAASRAAAATGAGAGASRTGEQAGSGQSSAGAVVSSVYEGVFTACMWLLVVAVSLLPRVGTPLSFVLTAWFYSFTLVQYRRAALPWSQRIAHVEAHWIYYLGFGTPLSVVAHVLPFWYRTGLLGVFLPLCLIMDAKPKRLSVPKPTLLLGSLRVMRLPTLIADIPFGFILRYSAPSKTAREQQ